MIVIKMLLKVSPHRIVGGKIQVSPMLGWLWVRVAEVKDDSVCVLSVLTIRGVSEALSWVRPLLYKQRLELSY